MAGNHFRLPYHCRVHTPVLVSHEDTYGTLWQQTCCGFVDMLVLIIYNFYLHVVRPPQANRTAYPHTLEVSRATDHLWTDIPKRNGRTGQQDIRSLSI